MEYDINRPEKKDIKDKEWQDAIIRNNCYIAKIDNKIVARAMFEFININKVMAKIDVFNNDPSLTKTLIDEFLWYNCYVETVIFNDQKYVNTKAEKVFKINKSFPKCRTIVLSLAFFYPFLVYLSFCGLALQQGLRAPRLQALQILS